MGCLIIATKVGIILRLRGFALRQLVHTSSSPAPPEQDITGGVRPYFRTIAEA